MFSQQGASMEDLRDTGVRLHEPGPPWLKREEEFVGVVLWAVGITTLAFLPDTGMFTPVSPPAFVGLKVVAALLWLLVGTQCLQRFAKRNTHEP
jgi:hypothetical protein